MSNDLRRQLTDDLCNKLCELSLNLYHGDPPEPDAWQTAQRAAEALQGTLPRLLTIDQVRKLPKETDVWIEQSTSSDGKTRLYACTLMSAGSAGVILNPGIVGMQFDRYNWHVYGWRLWTARPNETERRAAPWQT